LAGLFLADNVSVDISTALARDPGWTRIRQHPKTTKYWTFSAPVIENMGTETRWLRLTE
jgi:hypothetical protein